MGELFTSFEQAWQSFMGRDEPLEDFFQQFDEADDAVLEGWVVEPSDLVKRAAAEIQRDLASLDWLVPVPDHFLHAWIGNAERIGVAWEQWRSVTAFRAVYVRVNCFHTAVVVEVEGPIRRLVAGTRNDVPAFLPHMTVAVIRGRPAPDELREVLVPLRATKLGEHDVREVKRVRFPASRATLMQPWTVEQVVSLR